MRRRMSVRLVVAVSAVLLAQVFTLGSPTLRTAALADHNEDQHSANARLVFNSQNSTGATNSDLAFWGNRAYAGNYDGFRIFDISRPSNPTLLSDFRCVGAQNDVVAWQNKLVFTATDRTMTGPECGSTPTVEHDDPTGWEGVRIFDVSNPREPNQVGSVYTDCGAHTITVFPKNRHEVLLYVSSYPLRPGPTCGPLRGPENGNSPLHEKISVISVPLRHPEDARVVAEPTVSYPGDPDNRFDPDEHGLAGFNDLTGCHDISVHVDRRLAAAACAEQIQLWRIDRNGIPDTEHPVWVFDDKTDSDGAGGGDTGRDFWHTARITWDGRYVQIDDESFGSGCPVVTLGNEDTGRTHLLDMRTGRRLSTFQVPRTDDSPTAYCSVHQGNFVRTTDGRYLSVTAWYTGGIDVIDFTDPRRPREVAYYDIAGAGTAGSHNWAAYWYEGSQLSHDSLTIYGQDGFAGDPSPRGFEVFEVRLRGVRDRTVRHMNPQTVG